MKGLELARRIGDRASEWWSLGNLSETYLETGKWDEVMRCARRASQTVSSLRRSAST